MRYVRRRQIIKTKKFKVKPITIKVSRYAARKKGKDTWMAIDLGDKNRTIKERCSTFKMKSVLDTIYVHPYNQRGIDEVYIVTLGGGVECKWIRPDSWPKKENVNRLVFMSAIKEVSVQIEDAIKTKLIFG
jgi:hypothetical protein